MHFTVYMEDPAERAALFRMLEIWRDLTCSCAGIQQLGPGGAPGTRRHSLLGLGRPACRLPPLTGRTRSFSAPPAAARPLPAIPSTPRVVLRKPIGMEKLWAALHRCIKLWWDSLERLEITSDRCPGPPPPLRSGLGGEHPERQSGPRTQGPIATRETLTALEERLPKELFLRCQRGFLVNLRHVPASGQRRTATCQTGRSLPLSRSSRGETAEAYRKFCLLWDVRMRDGEKRHG